MNEDREAHIGDGDKERGSGEDVEGHGLHGEDREAHLGDGEKEKNSGDDVEGHALLPKTHGD
jgi:hypothetical protein